MVFKFPLNPAQSEFSSRNNPSERAANSCFECHIYTELFNLEGVTLQGITQNELVNGNGLPAGSYELCITPVMAVTDPATQQ